MKSRCLTILISFFLLIPITFADKGMIVIGPREVSLQESGQNAIVAWNGNEEILILSTDVKSSKSSLVLEVLPLPSNPTIREGSFDSFTKLVEIVNKKVRVIRERMPKGIKSLSTGIRGIEITFHKKLGVHDVTVVKVNDLNYFMNWVTNFTAKLGFSSAKISPEFKTSVEDYLNRDIKFFVFDVIESSEDRQSIKPLVYRFKTNFLYYPFKITAMSDASQSRSTINIFLITKGIINRDIIRKTGLFTGTGFRYGIELNGEELREISPDVADLFSSAHVMNAFYYGPINKLNEDLVVYQQDIYTPTFFDKISQAVSASLIFQFISGVGEGLAGYNPAWVKIFLTLLLSSFIVGIPSAVFIIAKSLEGLMKKYRVSGYNWLSYALSCVSVLILLLMNTSWTGTLIVGTILILVGFSTIVFLVIKLLRKIQEKSNAEGYE